MRLVFSLLRVAALCAFIVILWTKPKVADAQYGNTCATFALNEDYCPGCCSLHNSIDSITAADGPGQQSIGSAILACGSGTGCGPHITCGNIDDDVPTYNPNCDACN